MVLPPGYSLWWFSYKPFLWCRSDARLRHACCSFIFYKPFMWCRPDARLRHYYSWSFLSRSHSDPRLAPVLLFLQFPLEESFRPSLGTQYFIFVYFHPHVCILVFRYFVTDVWSHDNPEHVLIFYTRVLNVCEYIQTYSPACPWLLSWPDFCAWR